MFGYGLDTENDYRKDNLENITSGLKLWYDALCLIPKTHRQLHTSQRADKVSWTLGGNSGSDGINREYPAAKGAVEEAALSICASILHNKMSCNPSFRELTKPLS